MQTGRNSRATQPALSRGANAKTVERERECNPLPRPNMSDIFKTLKATQAVYDDLVAAIAKRHSLSLTVTPEITQPELYILGVAREQVEKARAAVLVEMVQYYEHEARRDGRL